MEFKRIFFPAAILLSIPLCAAAQDFVNYFENKTLRLDYVFTGNSSGQSIHLSEALCGGEWAGRRHNLDTVCLEGNGRIEVLEKGTGKVLYVNSFSTLFQEWLSEEEATKTDRSFENCFQVPWPKDPVDIRVSLMDIRGNTTATLTHPIDPSDILIRPVPVSAPSYRYLLQNGSPSQCIDLAIVGDGYTAEETDKFYDDAIRAVDALTAHEPFSSLKDRFNIVAVAAVSQESGVSIPHRGIWKRTLLKCHFDTCSQKTSALGTFCNCS